MATQATIKNMPMQSPMDLFVHELSDIRDAEQKLEKLLGQAQTMVQDDKVKQALNQHQEETRQQIQNLEQIFQTLGEQPHPIQCHAVEGLEQSLNEVKQSGPDKMVLEGAVIAGQSKSEHLEIAAYEGLITKAQAMNQSEIVKLLKQNLSQEQAALKKMEGFAQERARQSAQMMQS